MPYRSHHYLQFPHIRVRGWLPGLWGVYLNSLFRGIGQSLVNFFEPIYLYQLRGSILDVLMFNLVYQVVVVISGFFTTNIIRKIGIDWSSFVGAILRILYFLFLSLIPINMIFLYLAGISCGLMMNFCWIPFHYAVVALSDEERKYGKETSAVAMVDKLAWAIGPMVGGLCIVLFGFNNLFLLAAFFVFLSGIAFFFDDFVKKGMAFSTKRIVHDLVGKERRKIWFSLAGSSLETTIAAVLWPLFIFLNVKSFSEAGFIQGFSLVAALLLLFWIGKTIDQKGYGLVKWGFIVLTLTWLLRVFVSSGIGIFASNLVSEFGGILFYLPYSAWIYSRISQEKKTEFLLEREMVLNAAGALLCLFLMVFVKYFSWSLVFGLAIIALFMSIGGTYWEMREEVK